jgi:hypothetical protein
LVALGACAPLAVLNALSAGDSHTRVTDIAYGALPRQRLDRRRSDRRCGRRGRRSRNETAALSVRLQPDAAAIGFA